MLNDLEKKDKELTKVVQELKKYKEQVKLLDMNLEEKINVNKTYEKHKSKAEKELSGHIKERETLEVKMNLANDSVRTLETNVKDLENKLSGTAAELREKSRMTQEYAIKTEKKNKELINAMEELETLRLKLKDFDKKLAESNEESREIEKTNSVMDKELKHTVRDKEALEDKISNQV